MARIPLGIESSNPGSYNRRPGNRELKLAESIREDQNIEDDFQQALVCSNTDNLGVAYTGTAGQICGFHSGKHSYEYYVAAAAAPAIVMPFQSASGLELKPIAAADALEISCGVSALSKSAYVVGSLLEGKSIFMEANILIDDISDVTELFFGWRKAEAYQADPDSYDEMASFNIGKDSDGQIEIHSIINNAATVEVDTTETDWADGKAYKLRIEVANSGLCKFLITSAGASAAAAELLTLAEPTVTTAFSFDSGEVIVPFIHLNTETGDPGVSLSKWVVGIV